YENDEETGVTFRETGFSHSDVFVTTKYSGTNSHNILISIRNSLHRFGVSDIDLYLVHSLHLALPNIP
ncbi:uncharacterized protein HD556DRAFT_1214152, partial [Suillus plorans]